MLSSPGELCQILANIIGNAIDAMRHGGRLRIRISSAKMRDGSYGVRLTIGDTGSGISPKLLPKNLRTLRHHQGRNRHWTRPMGHC